MQRAKGRFNLIYGFLARQVSSGCALNSSPWTSLVVVADVPRGQCVLFSAVNPQANGKVFGKINAPVRFEFTLLA